MMRGKFIQNIGKHLLDGNMSLKKKLTKYKQPARQYSRLRNMQNIEYFTQLINISDDWDEAMSAATLVIDDDLDQALSDATHVTDDNWDEAMSDDAFLIDDDWDNAMTDATHVTDDNWMKL